MFRSTEFLEYSASGNLRSYIYEHPGQTSEDSLNMQYAFDAFDSKVNPFRTGERATAIFYNIPQLYNFSSRNNLLHLRAHIGRGIGYDIEQSFTYEYNDLGFPTKITVTSPDSELPLAIITIEYLQ